jgi:hypothetical protein
MEPSWESGALVGWPSSQKWQGGLACTRSFGHPMLDLAGLTEALTEFASRAAEKSRRTPASPFLVQSSIGDVTSPATLADV